MLSLQPSYLVFVYMRKDYDVICLTLRQRAHFCLKFLSSHVHRLKLYVSAHACVLKSTRLLISPQSQI